MKQLIHNPFFYLTICLVFVVAFEVVSMVRAQYAGPTAPPAGAAAVMVTVPVTNSPPSTTDGLREIDDSAASAAVTVNVPD